MGSLRSSAVDSLGSLSKNVPFAGVGVKKKSAA